MQKMPSMPSGRSRVAKAKLRKGDAAAGGGTLAAALVLVSLIIFTFGVRDGGSGFLTGVRSVAQTIVSPLQYAGAAVTAPFFGLSNVMRNLTAGEETLADLKAENERLSIRNVELEEAELTAHRLQELLDLRDTYSLESIAARVISGSSDSWTYTVSIDRGTAAGVAVGMPVVSQNAAVGQVISSSATTSTVRLLSDENSSVSAMVQSSRAQGMLKGSPDGVLHLAFIRTDQTVNVGDIVVTSGLGGVFPKGLPLGKVTSVDSTPGATYYEIEVEPFSRPENLEELLVVTSLTEGQRAGEEDIAAADAADRDAASGRAKENDDSVLGNTAQSADGTDSEGESQETPTSEVSLGTDESGTYGYSAQTGSALDVDPDDEQTLDAGVM